MTLTIGVLGGGQLGRMLALAGIPLGIRFRFIDPSAEAPAADVGRLTVAAYDDPDALRALADQCDVVTYEFENVPVERLRLLGEKLRPGVEALKVSQDRLAEKSFFEELGFTTAPFRAVDSLADLEAAALELGPGILKSRRMGYDGKGQARMKATAECAGAWQAVGEVPCVYEGLVDFSCEVSVIGVRGGAGEMAAYPLIQNVHRDGILRHSMAPAPAALEGLQERAQALVFAVMERLEYVGVLTVELFLLSDGRLLVNEMAPRVHNSGHLSIEASETSQFENHVRAIAGLPLGNTRLHCPAVMVNCIGKVPAREWVLAVPDFHFHHYGKADRPGRKVGHVTACLGASDDAGQVLARLNALLPDEEPQG